MPSSHKNLIMYPFLVVVGLLGWIVPGAGHLLINQTKRGLVIFAAIVGLFVLGIYVGSIGVIDPVNAKMWYIAQILTSPLTNILGQLTVTKGIYSFGRPAEIGQLFTSIAGLLNLFCFINAVHQAYLQKIEPSEE